MIPAILKWAPYTEFGIYFFYQIGKFCNGSFLKIRKQYFKHLVLLRL